MFLGIDLGTTNVKALVVDRAGKIVATGSAPVDRQCTPDGGVEQDIEQIWRAACQAIREAAGSAATRAGEGSDERADVEAVGVSSQGGALQLLDAELQPLGPVISWMDGRGRPFDQSLLEQLGESFFAEHVGCRSCLITPGQILRLRQQSPEILNEAAGIGYVGDVIVGRLCGRRAHDATSLSIAFLYNPSLGRADPELLRTLRIREESLPDLAPANVPAGMLRPEAAQATGLPAGIPVSPAVHDQYAASLGVGAVREGDVSLGAGTAWAMTANSGRLSPPVTRQAIVCPHPVQGLFGQMLSMVNGGSTIEWAARLTGRRLTHAELNSAMEAVSSGSDGLMLWPHLVCLAGSEAAAQGGGRIAGITLAHGPDHLLRAAVEGLCCELARHLQSLADGGCAITRVLLSGGAASSRMTPQIIADVTGRPVATVSEPAVSAFGAAILARAMLDPGADLARLAESFSLPRQTFLPGPHASTYRALLERYLAALR
jgi:sugar (pentulose or hexulose) kinase